MWAHSCRAWKAFLRMRQWRRLPWNVPGCEGSGFRHLEAHTTHSACPWASLLSPPRSDVDRQHIQDREKWKRDTAQKIKETKIKMMKLTGARAGQGGCACEACVREVPHQAALARVTGWHTLLRLAHHCSHALPASLQHTDNQLEMTTKRTIMENEQMSIELSYQSRQTEKLMAKNTVRLRHACAVHSAGARLARPCPCVLCALLTCASASAQHSAWNSERAPALRGVHGLRGLRARLVACTPWLCPSPILLFRHNNTSISSLPPCSPPRPCAAQILVTENADLRRQLGLSKQTEDELARRNTVYQRTIKGLVRACRWHGHKGVSLAWSYSLSTMRARSQPAGAGEAACAPLQPLTRAPPPPPRSSPSWMSRAPRKRRASRWSRWGGPARACLPGARLHVLPWRSAHTHAAVLGCAHGQRGRAHPATAFRVHCPAWLTGACGRGHTQELEDRASDAAAQVSLLRLQLEEQHQQKKEVRAASLLAGAMLARAPARPCPPAQPVRAAHTMRAAPLPAHTPSAHTPVASQVQKKLSAKTTELQDLQSSYDSTARFLAQVGAGTGGCGVSTACAHCPSASAPCARLLPASASARTTRA